MQERHNSSALAMELCLSCTNPSKWCVVRDASSAKRIVLKYIAQQITICKISLVCCLLEEFLYFFRFDVGKGITYQGTCQYFSCNIAYHIYVYIMIHNGWHFFMDDSHKKAFCCTLDFLFITLVMYGMRLIRNWRGTLHWLLISLFGSALIWST